MTELLTGIVCFIVGGIVGFFLGQKFKLLQDPSFDDRLRKREPQRKNQNSSTNHNINLKDFDIPEGFADTKV